MIRSRAAAGGRPCDSQRAPRPLMGGQKRGLVYCLPICCAFSRPTEAVLWMPPAGLPKRHRTVPNRASDGSLTVSF